MSHRAQIPPTLQLEAPPPDPEEKHDCRNTIIKCLREQVSQLKFIVELQKELRMGGPHYTGDPRGVEDTIITTIGRVETKIDALYNMVNGLTISVGDLRSEVRSRAAAGGGGPSGAGTSTRAKGKDLASKPLPVWEEKGDDVEMEFWGTERPSVTGDDTFIDATTKTRGITQNNPGQKKSSAEGKNTFSKTLCVGDDVVIPATNYSSWQSDPEPKRDAPFNNDWGLDDNELLDKEPASGQENDGWALPVNWNSYPYKHPPSGQRKDDWGASDDILLPRKQPTSGQRKDDWGASDDILLPRKQPTSGQRKDDWGASDDILLPRKQPTSGQELAGYYSSDQGGKKPVKPSMNNAASVSFWSESNIVNDQSDSKRKSSATGDKSSITGLSSSKIEITKWNNKPAKQQDKAADAQKRTNNAVSVNRSKNKWAGTIETDHGEFNDDGRDAMPGGWPPTQSQSQSQIETKSKPSVATSDNKSKTRIEVTGVSPDAKTPNSNSNNNVKDKKEMKATNQMPTWGRKEGDEKANKWGSTWDSNTSSEGWAVDQEKDKYKIQSKNKNNNRIESKDKDKDKENDKNKSKNKEKESSQKKSTTRPAAANEIYHDNGDGNGNDTEWASTQPWIDDEEEAADASDSDTISPGKYGGTW